MLLHHRLWTATFIWHINFSLLKKKKKKIGNLKVIYHKCFLLIATMVPTMAGTWSSTFVLNVLSKFVLSFFQRNLSSFLFFLSIKTYLMNILKGTFIHEHGNKGIESWIQSFQQNCHNFKLYPKLKLNLSGLQLEMALTES